MLNANVQCSYTLPRKRNITAGSEQEKGANSGGIGKVPEILAHLLPPSHSWEGFAVGSAEGRAGRHKARQMEEVRKGECKVRQG